MIYSLKTALAAATLMIAGSLVGTQAYAAEPDGMGPWADKVISTSQGMRKDGSAVLPARSDASSMLGVAENDTVDSHFYSLGFGGKATLAFKNGFRQGVIVVEATNPDYPAEKAKVEVSKNGHDFYEVGTVSQDGKVNVPDHLGCIRYVRVTDVSNKDDFSDASADGYDVDGVKADGKSCREEVHEDDCKPDKDKKAEWKEDRHDEAKKADGDSKDTRREYSHENKHGEVHEQLMSRIENMKVKAKIEL